MTTPIRPLTREDHTAWVELWRDYLAFYDTTRPPEVYDATFARLLDPISQQHGRLAYHGGAPVGLVHFLYHPHHWHIAPVCYLQDLFVAPQARCSGAGRALIRAVYDAADAAGAADVYWLTQTGNAPARALYDTLGVATDFIKYRREAQA